MAQLTYNVFTGELTGLSAGGRKTVMAWAESGFSNFWWDSSQRQKGQAATGDYVPRERLS